MLTGELGILLRVFAESSGDPRVSGVELFLFSEALDALFRWRKSSKAIKKAIIRPPRKEPTIEPARVPVLYLLPEAFFCESWSFVGRTVPEGMPGVEERTAEASRDDEAIRSVDVDVEFIAVIEVSEVMVLVVEEVIEEVVGEGLRGVEVSATGVATDDPSTISIIGVLIPEGMILEGRRNSCVGTPLALRNVAHVSGSFYDRGLRKA